MIRERLPNRRDSEVFDFEAQGLRFTATICRFADGRVAEVSITNHKAGSMAGINACDAAVVASIALQYGVPLEVIRTGSCATRADRRAAPWAWRSMSSPSRSAHHDDHHLRGLRRAGRGTKAQSQMVPGVLERQTPSVAARTSTSLLRAASHAGARAGAPLARS